MTREHCFLLSNSCLFRNAIVDNNVAEVQRIINLPEFNINSEINEVFGRGSPLHYASMHGSIEIVQLLINNGADVNMRDVIGRTPLYYAPRDERIEIVQLLINNGADVDMLCVYRETPLHWASRNGSIGIAQLLINKWVYIKMLDSNGWAPLHYASMHGSIEIVQLLINNGADVNILGSYRYTPLHCAISKDQREISQLLINEGADVNIQTYGQSPLHWAFCNEWIEVAQLLINKGADVNARGLDGWIPLHWTSRNGSIEISQLLISKGADVDIQDSMGNTPLHSAAKYNYQAICNLLILNGANVSLPSRTGHTPLDLANPTLRNMMTDIAVKFQNSYSSFEHAVTSGTIKTWNTPDNTIETRCAVYKKYLKNQNIDHRVSSDDMQSWIETNLGRDVSLINYPILKEIFCKEMTIYSHNGHEFFKDIIPDTPEYIDNEYHIAIHIAKSEEIMQLIFSYLDPSDINTGNGVDITGNQNIDNTEGDF